MQYLIKICGNVYADESLRVAACHPDYMGWIFAPRSPRRIQPQSAARIIQALRRRHPLIQHVAVFAGNPFQEMLQIQKTVKADYMQIVGTASLFWNASRLWKEELWPALRMQPDQNLSVPGHLLVLDAHAPGKMGGTGQRFAPELARGTVRPFLVAGGLRPENVAQAIREFQALAPGLRGVDVSSGIEYSPGRKNPRALRDFFAAVRSCEKSCE